MSRADHCPTCGVHALTHDVDRSTGLLVHREPDRLYCPDKGPDAYTCGWQEVTDHGTDSGDTNAGARISRWWQLACGHTLTEDIRQDHV